jgi:uncharacterized membrane protein
LSWYRHRLERDLARWQSSGWVSDTGAAAIRADLDTHKSAFGAAGIFAILGAVLFGFAIMSFVAAHWTAMSKLARLALLLAALWGCYAGAAVLFQRRLTAFAHAAVLGGIAVYGASIMLIAQMYHMEGNSPDAVFLWAVGALIAAVVAWSRPALAATFVLIAIWTSMERGLNWAAHWEFLAAWGITTGVAVWMGWRPALHLAAVSLIVWLVPLGYFILDRHAHWLVVLIGIAVAGATVLAPQAINRRLPAAAGALFAYGNIAAFAGLAILQFIDDGGWLLGTRHGEAIGPLVLLAIVTLAGLLASMLWSIVSDNRAALWLAYAGFALEVFLLYAKTFGTLLNTSLFFLVAAVLVSALAGLAYRLHQRKMARGVPA